MLEAIYIQNNVFLNTDLRLGIARVVIEFILFRDSEMKERIFESISYL